MEPSAWIRAAASLASLALGVAAASDGARDRLRRAVALCALDAAALHGADLASMHRLADLAGALLAPLALEVSLAFTGTLRAMSLARAAAWALALTSAVTRAAMPVDSRAAALTSAVAAAPALVVAATSLTRHARGATQSGEQTRARLLLGALLVGALLGAADALGRAFASAPRLGPHVTLACVTAVWLTALRVDRIERAPGRRAAADAVALAALGGVAAFAVAALAAGHAAAAAAGVALVAAACAVALYGALGRRAAEQERTRQLATIGRFAAQMAHDLKNPLAVATGAAQFLKEEHARGASLADHGDFLALMVDELERMRRVVDDYQRLGRVEVRRASVDPNELVRAVLALQGFAPGPRVTVTADLAAPLPRVALDRDLVENALTNLVRNAFEAMPAGGALTVRTEVPPSGRGVVITVADTGTGMDARTREQALDSFYTTRPEGSGLGLAYVRRVVDAHGGELSLTSEEGRGTVVRLHLPDPGIPA